MRQTMTSNFNSATSVSAMDVASSKSKQRLYNAINSPLRQNNSSMEQDNQNLGMARSSERASKQYLDREQLEYEQLMAKIENKGLEKQVKMLKTKVLMLYGELSKKDKLIEQFITSSVPDKQIQESCVVNTYKGQILELQKKSEDL